MKSNINRSHEVIENLRVAKGENSTAYAYAFGWAWAMLSETNRTKMLKLAQEMANEKDNN